MVGNSASSSLVMVEREGGPPSSSLLLLLLLMGSSEEGAEEKGWWRISGRDGLMAGGDVMAGDDVVTLSWGKSWAVARDASRRPERRLVRSESDIKM